MRRRWRRRRSRRPRSCRRRTERQRWSSPSGKADAPGVGRECIRAVHGGPRETAYVRVLVCGPGAPVWRGGRGGQLDICDAPRAPFGVHTRASKSSVCTPGGAPLWAHMHSAPRHLVAVRETFVARMNAPTSNGGETIRWHDLFSCLRDPERRHGLRRVSGSPCLQWPP